MIRKECTSLGIEMLRKNAADSAQPQSVLPRRSFAYVGWLDALLNDDSSW